MMTDRCRACGSTDNNGWLLETVIDYDTNLVTSREVPCAACGARRAEAVAARRAHAKNGSPDSDEQLVLKLAQEEIDATVGRKSGAAPVPVPHLGVHDRPLPAA
jgi:hypothetical protein